jgi:hypothetical protein
MGGLALFFSPINSFQIEILSTDCGAGMRLAEPAVVCARIQLGVYTSQFLRKTLHGFIFRAAFWFWQPCND